MKFARQSRRRSRFVPVLAGLLTLLVSAAPASAAAGWTGPTQIGTVSDCSDVALAIDSEGATHVAAACGGSVRHLTDATGAWATTTFSHPSNRVDLDPQIAIDGDIIHIAYTRAIPSGDAFVSIGVYHRERALDGDTWSTAVRLGSSGDTLGGFTVVDGVVHATVAARNGDVFYETDKTGTLRRWPLPEAAFPGSLHVESDGAPRFAYDTGISLRYAVFHGSGFDWWLIPGTDPGSQDPQLALDADNKAHVTWTQIGLPAPGAASGVFYATNRTGEWKMIGNGRVTANYGDSALEIDLETGRPHVMVATNAAVKYYTQVSATGWGGVTINPLVADDVDIAIDRATGRLVVVSSRLTADLPANLFLHTKP